MSGRISKPIPVGRSRARDKLSGMPHSHETGREPTGTSSAAQEYLACLRNLVASGQHATVTTVARRLHVSPQAASEMVQRLRGEGLVELSESRELQLTAAGRALADEIFRRHALVEWLLTGISVVIALATSLSTADLCSPLFWTQSSSVSASICCAWASPMDSTRRCLHSAPRRPPHTFRFWVQQPK